MRPEYKSILVNLPKADLQILAFADFLIAWLKYHDMFSLEPCSGCSWYEPWCYNTEPAVILIAASLLSINRWWGYLASAVISAYPAVYFIWAMATSGRTPAEMLFDLLRSLLRIILGREFHYYLAFIVFFFALYYLTMSFIAERPKNCVTGEKCAKA